jgi:hypothetical protein
MCDGCPDITVHDGQLVWSCRLEEQLKFGCWIRAVPKSGAPVGPCGSPCPPASAGGPG